MNRWRILVVDDNTTIAQQTADLLRSEPISVGGDMADFEWETSFDRALQLLEKEHYDLLVLDVRDQSRTDEPTDSNQHSGTEATYLDVGLQVFDQVRARRFVPIVFFTALPNLVQGLIRPPFVALVSKYANDATGELRKNIRAVFDSTLPAINRALRDHVEKITRDFMAGFVEEHWNELRSPTHKGDLAHLLLRRLALSLADGGAVLSERLAGEPDIDLTPDTVHPMRYYIVPPVGSWTTGDVITGPEVATATRPHTSSELTVPSDQDVAKPGTVEGQRRNTRWYVVLTPACDLVPNRVKADFVVLVECLPLAETEEFKTWKETLPPADAARSSAAEKSEKLLRKVMVNNADGRPKDRNMYLPAAWSVPDLLVDFQRVVYLPYGDIEAYKRVATLDSPYAESLVAKFGRYLGRLGTPDLDVNIPVNRLRKG